MIKGIEAYQKKEQAEEILKLGASLTPEKLHEILEVNAEFVKMDFNHPLAGKDLHFEGDILEVREATADEISHGHVHGPGGHHH